MHKIKFLQSHLISRYAHYLIPLLLGVAIFLGITIYREIVAKRPPPLSIKSPPQSGSALGPTSSSASTDEEIQQLLGIRQDSSDEEKKRHFDLVQKLARDAEYLNITNCAPQPIVIRVKDGSHLIVKNSDDEMLEIGIDPQHLYGIPAQGEKKIKIAFGNGPGIYGYGCNKSSGAVGMFYVVP